jgi:hypothetical protein
VACICLSAGRQPPTSPAASSLEPRRAAPPETGAAAARAALRVPGPSAQPPPLPCVHETGTCIGSTRTFITETNGMQLSRIEC